MLHQSSLYSDWIDFILIIAIGLGIGLFLDRIVYPRLRKRYARNQNANSRIIVKALGGTTIIWSVLGSLYAALLFIELGTDLEEQLNLVIFLGYIITITWFLVQMTRGLIDFYTRKQKLPKTTIFSSVAKLIIYILAFTVGLRIFGVSVTPFIAAAGLLSLAIALALQPTLANLFAGMSLLASKQLNIGDYVKLSNTEEGHIVDIHWRSTAIETLQKNLVIIPNSQLSNMVITNFSLPEKQMRLIVPVGVHYNSDFDLVEEISRDVAREIQLSVEGAIPDWEPTIRYRQFSAYSVDFNVVLLVNEFANQFQVRHLFIKQLLKKYKEHDIVIPYPITTVEFGKDNPVNIPRTAQDE